MAAVTEPDPTDEPLPGEEGTGEPDQLKRPVGKGVVALDKMEAFLQKSGTELKLPSFAGKVDIEAQLAEAMLAFRGKFFDEGLWASEFLAMPDMQADALGTYILAMNLSQDDKAWPNNLVDILDEIHSLPPSVKGNMGLMKVAYAANYMKRTKLGIKELQEPLKPVPAKFMSTLVRADLEDWQLPAEEAGVVQIAEIIANASRRLRLCVMCIDGSPYMESPYGGGKSQLLIQLLYWAYRELGAKACAVCKKFLGCIKEETCKLCGAELTPVDFDLRKDIVFRKDRDRMLRMFRAYDRRLPWGIDELDQFYDRRSWARAENKAVVEALQMYRKAGSPVIGACGSLWNLDERMRHKILTFRLEIQSWDDDAYRGKAALFRKWGPPAWQDELQNQWGRWVMNIEFNGLTKPQFDLYNACNLKCMENEERGGMDTFLLKHPTWGVDGGPLLDEEEMAGTPGT